MNINIILKFQFKNNMKLNENKYINIFSIINVKENLDKKMTFYISI